MASSWSSVLVVAVVLLVHSWAGLAPHPVEARALYQKHPLIRRSWNILRGSSAGLSIAELDYYVQVDIGPGLGVLIEPINTTYSNNFGQTQLFSLNVTEGADPTSTQVGNMYGYTVQASYIASATHGVEVEVLVYDDGSVNGTISIQGHIVNGASEIAIVGGTGDFRGASGYGLVTFVNATGSIFTFRHELHFL
eukprot:c16294_g1_i1 orf=458-1039(-)